MTYTKRKSPKMRGSSLGVLHLVSQSADEHLESESERLTVTKQW